MNAISIGKILLTFFISWIVLEVKYTEQFCSIIYIIHKIVRKFGKNRDFVKLHPSPRNWVFNIWKNSLPGVERTLWTSSRSNMNVRRLKSLLPFYPHHDFEVNFCKTGFLNNKRSTLICWLQSLPSERFNIKLQKTYLSFFHSAHTFFDILTFVLLCAELPFRKFKVQFSKYARPPFCP